MHFGFLAGFCVDKASLQLDHKPSIITLQQCCISNSPQTAEIKKGSSQDKNKPSFPERSTHMQSAVARKG